MWQAIIPNSTAGPQGSTSRRSNTQRERRTIHEFSSVVIWCGLLRSRGPKCTVGGGEEMAQSEDVVDPFVGSEVGQRIIIPD